MIEPPTANEGCDSPTIGRTVNEKSGSPIPARGPHHTKLLHLECGIIDISTVTILLQGQELQQMIERHVWVSIKNSSDVLLSSNNNNGGGGKERSKVTWISLILTHTLAAPNPSV
ncbi:hypothetical protein [Lactococcus cremoris]|uniref:hypothetical protein n=1 Tax=Lactococcus lactis subsp. cremoris TaxID=1359 RepID=UPI0005827B31|nr:hypothetical protein [Lactococcus cremoris]KGH33273.1 hypothetical protein JL36_07255 [Lactococcus cremoris]